MCEKPLQTPYRPCFENSRPECTADAESEWRQFKAVGTCRFISYKMLEAFNTRVVWLTRACQLAFWKGTGRLTKWGYHPNTQGEGQYAM